MSYVRGNGEGGSTYFAVRRDGNFRGRAPRNSNRNEWQGGTSRRQTYGSGRVGNLYGKSMSFVFMENLLKNDPEQIILVLLNERKGFLQLLEADELTTSNMIVLILKILRKVCSASFDDTKYIVLHTALNENFINTLRTFIACLPTQDTVQRKNSNYFWDDPIDFWSNLVEICGNILQATPTFACKTIPTVLKALKVYMPIVEQEQDVKISDEIKQKVERMMQVVQTMIKDNEEKSAKEPAKAETVEPPDDFRQISVYPSPEEVVGGRGFLRENVVKGPYQNVNHYLDVQFRLLREDFVAPLRQGIANYRSPTPESHQVENVKVHKGVRFLNTETINEYYCLRVQFNPGKKKSQNFENFKRFMYGSLLCFTRDNFKSLIFGKVSQRKVEDLEKGQLIVAFDEKLDVIRYNTDYLMVECSVYFEPYFHVLTVLKNMTEENFPMERYFIRVNPSVQPAEYLTAPNSTYDIEGHKFNPLLEWPTENFYNLNESQLVAFKAAVTQEISVIQGPPGTGKTYLGLKVAETLLKNIGCWYDRTPMLVICFTNHALDQFLEGLIPYTKNIVRVGGQSKNEKLESYNLRNRSERDEAVAVKRREVQDSLSEIKRITEILEEIEFYNGVLLFNTFVEVVPNLRGTWFYSADRSRIIDWLLEGGACGQPLNLQDHLNTMLVEQEFNNIGINDDRNYAYNDDGYFLGATFNDSIFYDVLSDFLKSSRKSNSFLITLKSMRDRLKEQEDVLLRLRQEESPTLEQLIREEKLYFQLLEMRQKYEYVKEQLSEGRRKRNTAEEPQNVDLRNPFNMRFEDRWKLYFHWLNLYKNRESDVLKMTSQDFPDVYKVYEQMREIADVRTMKDALVVGMTTTSAARLRSSLQTLKNPIVIVEEAAEVLEAHIVTSITKHCKHLILIGDHKQLKPNTASFNLEKRYHLGVSLFERMIVNNIHCYTLNVQHRMRPEISCLIRPTIYSFLEDHPSVNHRPPITGIDNCIFFIDHNHPEESYDGSSKTNQHEVTFLIYLARHLVLNGYNPENVTILAAYLGQFFAFQKEKKNHLDLLQKMRVAVLDNYQGEESDIVLLSLVRNNDENKIGFLKIENRVCVALSRARNGMYIMGNMAQLCHEGKLWPKIKASLQEQNAVGTELSLRCQIHQDQVTRVKCDTDFLAISEGGCSKKCDMELSCGHKCTSVCHILNRNHLYYKCQIQCNKSLCKNDETHVCKKMCYEDCGPCMYLVNRTLACGHNVNIECHIDPETYKCQVSVVTELPCTHITEKPCYCDPAIYRCPHICDIKVEPCGHACELSCHIRRDPDHLEYKCQKPCTKFKKNCTVQEDDHRCIKRCHEDCDRCEIVVRKRRTVCPHFYDVACFEDVDELDCEKPCTKILECGHKCTGKCNEVCHECQYRVTKTNPVCGHSIAGVKCNEFPDRKKCNRKCPLKLPCGHLCTAKCNEPCTTICKVVIDFPDGIAAECGHMVTRIECGMANSSLDLKSLLQYCKEPCGMELKCGHLCSGNCGECAQGRIHKRCTEICGAVLVCDHQCDFPCRQACRSCKRVCSYRCQHSSCRRTCGEVCTPCKERCTRNCIHQKCTKFCGDICNVSPCTKPCKKLLKCGHPCIGFCGDQCPPKCLVCDKDELLEIFFGTESEDARYVLLNDCKHIVENEGMEQWLQQNANQISYKLCPLCKTAIKTTQRYSDYIKRAVIDVAQVKIKASGKPAEIEEKKREFDEIFRRIRKKCGREIIQNYRGLHLTINASNLLGAQVNSLLKTLQSRLKVSKKGKRQPINIYELHSIKSKLQIIEHVVDICHNDVADATEFFLPQVNFIFNALGRDADYIADQEIDDISSEINRLSRIVEFGLMKKSSQFAHYLANNDVAKHLINDIEQNIFICKPFTKEDNDGLKELLKELNSLTSSGIAISDSEKREILKAMGFSKGHWFKCPNGHIYAIGECGGAMEESKCNECGAKIGGSQHRLLQDNAVATEMDGARVGAWNEAVNLRNYDMAFFENL